MTKIDNLSNIYKECSNGYHKVDDFRTKLLGFLPLASGIGIFGAIYIDPGKVALGVFGFLTMLGLLVFELKGIVKCTQFIVLGSWIEAKLNEATTDDNGVKQDFDKQLSGYFTELIDRKIMMGVFINEPVASAIIYSTVLAAWSYVICLKSDLEIIVPVVVFILSASFVYIYWWKIYNNIKARFRNTSATAIEEDQKGIIKDDSNAITV